MQGTTGKDEMLEDVNDHPPKQRDTLLPCKRQMSFTIFDEKEPRSVAVEEYVLERAFDDEGQPRQPRVVLIWRKLLTPVQQQKVVSKLLEGREPAKTEQPHVTLNKQAATEELTRIANPAIRELLRCEQLDPEFDFNAGDIMPVGYPNGGSMGEHLDGQETHHNYAGAGFVCNISIGAKTKFNVATWPKRKTTASVELNSGDVIAFNGSLLHHQITVTEENIPDWITETEFIRYSVQLRDMSKYNVWPDPAPGK